MVKVRKMAVRFEFATLNVKTAYAVKRLVGVTVKKTGLVVHVRFVQKGGAGQTVMKNSHSV